MVIANIEIIKELRDFLIEISTNKLKRKEYTFKESDFTRQRTLSFDRIVGILLNMPKRSLGIEIREFFDSLSTGESCSKSAFSQQRSKLNPIFFHDWLALLVKLFYQHYADKAKRWRGYLIQAVDGSTVYLPNTEEVIDYFGTQENQHVSVAMAQVMQLHDVLNDLTIWGDIYPRRTSEQTIMINNIHRLGQDSITLFDRGYSSYALMYMLKNQPQECLFVMRIKEGLNREVKDFVASSSLDQITSMKVNYKAMKKLKKYGYDVSKETEMQVRLVKVPLSSGQTEVLATNLYDQKKYSIEDLSYLYFLRWGIETCYGKEKNQLQLEIFSGHRMVCILQDFYATLFVANLQSLIEKQSQEYLKTVSKRRKYNYKINKNTSWAALKNTLFKLFLENDEPWQLLKSLQLLFEEFLEPIRPNRKVKRVKKTMKRCGKYQTLTNYKRAI